MKLFTLPNFITLGNLLFGCIGIICVFEGNMQFASYCMLVSLILDFFDGFVARLLHISSDIGKQLDSLADVVTFGVLPSMMLYKYLDALNVGNLRYVAFLIALFSALRLAKFNIDERQSDGFIGLPTPAQGILVATFPFLIKEPIWTDYLNSPVFLIAYILIFSYLLVMELPLVAFKFKSFSWHDQKTKYLFIILCVILLLILKVAAVPLILILYIILSLLVHLKLISK